MDHLPSAEPKDHLGLVAVLQEPDQVAQLDLVVALLRPRAELHLLDLDLLLLLPLSCLGLLQVEQVLAVVHHLDDRRIGIRGDEHQIQSFPPRLAQGVLPGDDANLPTVRADEPHLAGANILVQHGSGRLCFPC